MEELYINKTKNTQKEYDLFLKSYQEEYAVSENLYTLFYLVFFTFCLIFAFCNGETLLGVLITIGLVIYIWYKFIHPIKRVNKEKKSDKITKKYTNTFKFYKNYFKVENPEGEAQIFYFKLYRVVETKTHFYIYISREYAFIVSKNGFEKGDSREFSKFIKKKSFNKYRNRINTKNK